MAVETGPVHINVNIARLCNIALTKIPSYSLYLKTLAIYIVELSVLKYIHLNKYQF